MWWWYSSSVCARGKKAIIQCITKGQKVQTSQWPQPPRLSRTILRTNWVWIHRSSKGLFMISQHLHPRPQGLPVRIPAGCVLRPLTMKMMLSVIIFKVTLQDQRQVTFLEEEGGCQTMSHPGWKRRKILCLNHRLWDRWLQYTGMKLSIHSYSDILPQRFLLFWLSSNFNIKISKACKSIRNTCNCRL